jgi:hypothetical protein
LQGFRELQLALADLGSISSAEHKSMLRSMVAASANRVVKRAKTNMAGISPGKAPYHKTYKGRIVSAGFASRNIRSRTRIYDRKGLAVSRISATREAFYAVNFLEKGVPKYGMPSRPWLVPALESSKDEIVQSVTDSVLRRIAQVKRKRGLGK